MPWSLIHLCCFTSKTWIYRIIVHLKYYNFTKLIQVDGLTDLLYCPYNALKKLKKFKYSLPEKIVFILCISVRNSEMTCFIKKKKLVSVYTTQLTYVSPFYKTLPRGSVFVNWISVWFYEMDCTLRILCTFCCFF